MIPVPRTLLQEARDRIAKQTLHDSDPLVERLDLLIREPVELPDSPVKYYCLANDPDGNYLTWSVDSDGVVRRRVPRIWESSTLRASSFLDTETYREIPKP